MIGSVTVSGTYVNHFKASPWKSKTKQLEWSLGWFIIKDSLLLPMGKPFGRLGLPGIPYQNRCVKDTLLAVQLFLRPPPGSVMGALIKNLQDHQCNAQQYHDINHPVMNVVLGWFDCFFFSGIRCNFTETQGWSAGAGTCFWTERECALHVNMLNFAGSKHCIFFGGIEARINLEYMIMRTSEL